MPGRTQIAPGGDSHHHYTPHAAVPHIAAGRGGLGHSGQFSGMTNASSRLFPYYEDLEGIGHNPRSRVGSFLGWLGSRLMRLEESHGRDRRFLDRNLLALHHLPTLFGGLLLEGEDSGKQC